MVQLRYLEDFYNTSSWDKWVNSSKIIKSFYKSMFTGEAAISGMPMSLSIEPTTSCNLRCPQCISGLRDFTRPTGMLSETMFINVINALGKYLWYINFYFQGEPFLHEQFTDMVRYATSRHIYVSTSTNAHYLSPEVCSKIVKSGLHKLIISIDGLTQDTYEKYRVGGKLDKVQDGIKNIIGAKKKYKSQSPLISLQYIVFKYNIHEISQVRNTLHLLGADEVLIKTAQVYHSHEPDEWIPQSDKYSRYKVSDTGNYTIKNKIEDRCWKMWHSAVVTWDGRVVPCCFDKDAKYEMGNITNTPFEKIWYGNEYNNFRKKLITSRKDIDICTNCSEGSKIWV
ncbi:MAG: radical SAM/SPASM domain-containing protein [Cytophagales bacterium]|nr:radical SAM/SPASM domain-containing protein [Cytophagales bacterium]